MISILDGRKEFYQWDTGRSIVIECPCTQAHFRNSMSGETYNVEVYEKDGKRLADVPDVLLQSTFDITAYVYVCEEKDESGECGYTECCETFKVVSRNKPEDYVFTPDDQITLKEALNKIIEVAEKLIEEEIDNKVDKIDGKGLSTNDYTDKDKEKLAKLVDGVTSVAGRKGDVTLTKSDVGLDKVDNTSDMEKPISNSVKSELDRRIPTKMSQLEDDKSLLNYEQGNYLISEHDSNQYSHSDIRIFLSDLENRLNGILDSDDTTLDQLSEIVAYIKSNKDLIDSITTSKVNVSDIVDNVYTSDSSSPLSANMGCYLEYNKINYSDIIDNLFTYESSKPLSASMGAYLYSSIPIRIGQLTNDINLIDTYTAENLIYNHNVDTTTHNDIRYEIQQIADRLTAFLDTDDTTLDQVSEIVSYINSNKELIDAITTSKVNVSDIVDDLQTSSSDRPLSANQGVQLMSMLNNLALDLYGFLDNTSDGNMYPLSNLIQQVYNKIDSTSIVDDLTTWWGSYLPLSASQGYILDTNKINYTDIVDNLSTTNSSLPLSANQGYYLDMNKINYTDIIYDSFDNIPSYNAGGAYNPLSASLGYELYQSKIGFDSLVTDPSSMWYEDNYSVLSAYYGKYLYDYISLVAQNMPTSMSDLINNADYVQDSDYTHTDNNFTDEYKEKLDNLGENTGGSGSSGITHSWNGTVLTITSDSGTSSADLKGDKGDTPNVEFHYDEETGDLYYKVDGTLVGGGSRWKLIGECETTEEVSGITIESDIIYDEIIAEVYVPPISEDTGGTTYVRPILKNNSKLNANVGFAKPSTTPQRELWYMKCGWGIRQYQKSASGAVAYTVAGFTPQLLQSIQDDFEIGGGFTGFSILWNLNNTFPVGVKMQVWGRN